MKICLVGAKGENMNRGSYRIWIHDLNFYLNKLGIKSTINPQNIQDYDYIILDKSILENVIKLKKKISKKVYIAINPSCENKNYHTHFDYCIVGSVEEKISLLKYYRKIFVIPLIEKLYFNQKFKEHKQKNIITIGYHGNLTHLNSFNLGCKQALERLAKEVNIILLIFNSDVAENNKLWKIGKPSPSQSFRGNFKIKYKKWLIDTIAQDLLEVDIGIVPYFTEVDLKNCHYFLKFKNKGNSGRCLVFHQLKIPVVADMIPQNMYILSNPDNGYAVCGEESWYRAFKELLSEKQRQFISENAYNSFSEKYNPLKWVQRFIDELN